MRHDVKPRIQALGVAVLLTLAGAGSSFAGFLHYDAPVLPPSNDCAAVAAAVGPGATWRGEFAGFRYDSFSDRYFPFSARSCFETQSECRYWQAAVSAYIEQGKITYTTCRRGG
jgi:hypothetical protein